MSMSFSGTGGWLMVYGRTAVKCAVLLGANRGSECVRKQESRRLQCCLLYILSHGQIAEQKGKLADGHVLFPFTRSSLQMLCWECCCMRMLRDSTEASGSIVHSTAVHASEDYVTCENVTLLHTVLDCVSMHCASCTAIYFRAKSLEADVCNFKHFLHVRLEVVSFLK